MKKMRLVGELEECRGHRGFMKRGEFSSEGKVTFDGLLEVTKISGERIANREKFG